MNLLFIHGNFPGQFTDIAPEITRRIGAKTVFLTLAENVQNIQLPGVSFVRFSLHRDAGNETHQYLQVTEEAILKGQAVLRALFNLAEEGFVPDVVICHGGMGFGLYVKAFLPKVKLISYMEWYFTIENSGAIFSNIQLDDHLRLQTRNLPLLQEMVVADEIVCPTVWQSRQFPEMFRDKIKVIFDGVDVNLFKPALPVHPFSLKSEYAPERLQFKSEDLLLTYGTRGMEPLRGFPEFMRAAAVAQKQYPELQVVIFGRDRSAYSYQCDQFNGSWKEALLDELAGQLDFNRLHFTGLLTYGDLIRLFHRSDLHCYFTRPYVVSWGVFQAAACGSNLLVNRFDGMDEVFAGGEPLIPPVDLEDQSSVTDGVLKALKQRQKNLLFSGSEFRESQLSQGLDLQQCLNQWEQLLINLTID